MITVSQALASASVVAEEIDPDSRESLIDNALPIAGLFVLVLLVAMYFLWRSMSKQMKRIDPSLPDGPDDREQARDRAITREAAKRGEAADPDDVAR
jgi:ABC-type nickel/cobalt efflux system permease component RcnA